MRRTLEDRRNAEELAREHIEELLQLHPNATTADKLEYLINRGYLSSTIAGVMLISESSVKRAKAALKGGRLIGRRGRPTYLTREQEEELERWCIEENSSGRVPPISDVISKAHDLATLRWNLFRAPGNFNSEPALPSPSWFTGYIARRLRLQTIFGKTIDTTP